MCGILGFTRRSAEAEQLMPFLAAEMVKRGKDSWGVTDGYRVQKTLGPITQSWTLPSWGDALIIHTRAGSVGDKTLHNQHPFVFDCLDVEGEKTGGYVVGVHNGGLSNHAVLNKDYKRNFPVDSMHFYAHLAEGWPMEELWGYGAFVWFSVEPNTQREMFFAKVNMYDLHVYRLEKSGGLVFCSVPGPIEDATELLGIEVRKLALADNKVYAVEEGEQQGLVEVMDIKFGGRYKAHWEAKQNLLHNQEPWQSPYAYFDDDVREAYTSPTGKDLSEEMEKMLEVLFPSTPRDLTGVTELCTGCKLEEIVPGKELFCPSCLAKAFDEFREKGLVRYEYRF